MDTSSPKINEDPFAYLERDRFTSEKFKIEIRGLPKNYGLNEFKKLLKNKLKLKPCKIKPPRVRSEWLYVCFRSEEDRRIAIEKLSGYVWKNKKLSAQVASAVPDPLIQKRNDREKSGKIRKDMPANELLKHNTVPLWNIPYENQLEIKRENVRSILEELTKEILHFNKSGKIFKCLEKRCEVNKGMICDLSNIRHVSFDLLQNGYRNKCEFTIGINDETNLKTIGFRLGAYVNGSTSVGPINDLPHVPERMKKVVNGFENLIRNTELNVYNPENHSGFWKQLTVRLGMNTNQLMVVIGAIAEAINIDQLKQIKDDIVGYFNNDGKCYEVTSLYFQNLATKTKNLDGSCLELLSGSPTITEKLCGLEFNISPFSFFQIHTAAAEILFNSVAELIPPAENITLLDICCGTGTVGLCLSKNCGQVLGIESESSAIENAKLNCVQNGIENCTFFNGKAEEILPAVIHKSNYQDIIAVVDPPRAGLHKKAILQLRRTANIKKIIYLSCNPKAALHNFIDLGRPPSKTLHGSQFFPMRAIPVDNFPHTNHCELILYFERFDLDEICTESKDL